MKKKLSVTLNTTDTVSVLKQKIAEQLKSTDTPLEPDQQILIYAGRILKNDAETIESIKIKNGNTIHMVKAKPKQKPAETTEKAAETTTTTSETSSTPAPASSNTTTPVSAQPAAPQPSPMSGGANAAANPFAQLGQAGGNPFAQLGFNSGFAAGMNNQSPFGGNLPPLDPNMFNEMLNNPAVLNMLSSMFQNPQMMDMLFSSSPQLAAFNTPEFRSTMNQMMSNPETLRSILQLSNMYGNMFGGAGGNAAANPFAQFQAPGTTPAANTASTPTSGTTPGANTNTPQMPDMSALLSMLGGMPGMGAPGATTGTTGAAANNAANQQPPEVRYSTQLAQLQDMGFYDSAQNIRALTISGGRVEAAVEWLLNNPF